MKPLFEVEVINSSTKLRKTLFHGKDYYLILGYRLVIVALNNEYKEYLPFVYKDGCPLIPNIDFTIQYNDDIANKQCHIEQSRIKYSFGEFDYKALPDYTIVLCGGGGGGGNSPQGTTHGSIGKPQLAAIKLSEYERRMSKDNFPPPKVSEYKFTIPSQLPSRIYKITAGSNIINEKEKDMNHNSQLMQALTVLADKSVSEELQSFGIELVQNDKELSDAIAALKAEDRKKAIQQAAGAIIELGKAADQAIADKVAALRAIRAQEKAILKTIQSINLAKEYAAETRNYLPLLRMTTGMYPSENIDLATIPSMWVIARENASEKTTKPAHAKTTTAKVTAAKTTAAKSVAKK